IEIGRYYSFYKKRKRALEYFQISLEINQALLKEGKIHQSELVNNYYAFVSTYRELDDFPLAKKYLDSCFHYYTPLYSPIAKAYLEFEAACISNAEEKYVEALAGFTKTEDWFVENEPSYLVLFYTYKGDALRGLNRLDESEAYYLKALNISHEYNMHIDFSPIVHEKLSELYLKKGDFQAAFASLKNVKDLDAAFFDSRSAKNRSLLEIQDAFRMEQKAQQELKKEQKLERLEHEKDVWFLQRVIGGVSILFIICVSYLYFSYIRANYRAEKEILRKEKEMELQKANEVLEVKNKELAASALKLIEKDENLSLLKNKVKEADGDLKPGELKKIIRSISVSNDHNWKEFETRFIAVNKGFYRNMQDKFPKLSQKDLKLCALIKLNFSCKEMAKLLGISVESAHTSRYRLRKKLNLTRDVNLTEFIANI
ncbi:MAG: tetratricopeptide repeat protein, partial [Bacteroidota bacterium]